jgi:hypothetical protein
MGLKVTTIARLPEKTGRAFFVYFLDYGWEDDLTRAMYENFDVFAAIAAENRSLLIAGLNRIEFANEVLSWHHVNGQAAHDLLPAIMITDIEPALLTGQNSFDFGPLKHRPHSGATYPERFVLLPLREIGRTSGDVTQLLQQIANDLRSGKALSEFEIKSVKQKGETSAANMVVLQPNIGGLGVDLKEIFNWSREKWQSWARKGERA